MRWPHPSVKSSLFPKETSPSAFCSSLALPSSYSQGRSSPHLASCQKLSLRQPWVIPGKEKFWMLPSLLLIGYSPWFLRVTSTINSSGGYNRSIRREGSLNRQTSGTQTWPLGPDSPNRKSNLENAYSHIIDNQLSSVAWIGIPPAGVWKSSQESIMRHQCCPSGKVIYGRKPLASVTLFYWIFFSHQATKFKPSLPTLIPWALILIFYCL